MSDDDGGGDFDSEVKSSSSSSSKRKKSRSFSSQQPGFKPDSDAAHDPNPAKVDKPFHIGNKIKRQEVYQKKKHELHKLKAKERRKRKLEAEALGEEARPKKVQKTLDNTREADETVVAADDEEVKNDEKMDEFSAYFSGEKQPKILITTCYHPSKVMYEFIKDLLLVFPNSFYYKRKGYQLQQIAEYASEKGFTDMIVLNEDRKIINGWTQIHLPDGPTAYFKISSLVLHKDIQNAGTVQLSRPEVILNNFNTRLGHRVGRMLGALFHQDPHFRGRRVVTFHNQRDFIFFRHHRYVFDDADTARIQELGPRFTLKLQWLQSGTFATKTGEYEWLHKPEMDTSRRRFFL